MLGWFTPRTWVNGDFVTPAKGNTYIRDAMLCKIAMCRLICTITGTVGADSSDVMTWSSAQTDPLAMWDGATKITAPTPGQYRVIARWGGSGSFGTTIAMRKNGQDILLSDGGASAGNLIVGAWTVQLAKGDYLELVYTISAAGGYTLSTTAIGVGGASADILVQWVAP